MTTKGEKLQEKSEPIGRNLLCKISRAVLLIKNDIDSIEMRAIFVWITTVVVDPEILQQAVMVLLFAMMSKGHSKQIGVWRKYPTKSCCIYIAIIRLICHVSFIACHA